MAFLTASKSLVLTNGCHINRRSKRWSKMVCVTPVPELQKPAVAAVLTLRHVALRTRAYQKPRILQIPLREPLRRLRRRCQWRKKSRRMDQTNHWWNKSQTCTRLVVSPPTLESIDKLKSKPHGSDYHSVRGFLLALPPPAVAASPSSYRPSTLLTSRSQPIIIGHRS